MSTKVRFDDGNHSLFLSVQRKRWRAFSFDVHSKRPLHSASLVLKKSDSPWMWSRQLPRPTVPLRQADFVFKCFKTFKAASWHASWWLGTLIANLEEVAKLGVFCVRNLRGTTSCTSPPLFWQACFEYQSFLGIWKCVEGEQAGSHTSTYNVFVCWFVNRYWQSLCGQGVTVNSEWIAVALLSCELVHK